MDYEVVKITEDGKIRLPKSIMQNLNLWNGGKVAIVKEDGKFYLANSGPLAFERVQKAFEGAAAEAGFDDEESLQEYMKEIRKEVRGY